MAQSEMPRLSRETFASATHPERVVQFGTGAFLRGFVESFVDEANARGEFDGSIVAVGSTGSTRDEVLNAQDGLYTLLVQGMESNAPHRSYRVVGSLSRALSARDEWDAVLALARDPEIRLVVSNTTEVGIVLDDGDSFVARPPRSFPGKLTRFLYERASHFGFDRSKGLVVLPCELIDDNGSALRGIVHELAWRWRLDPQFTAWLDSAVRFCNTLVDRIVPGTPEREEVERVEQRFGYRDGMITACEPYALFAIEGDDALRTRLGFAGDDKRIIVAPDIRPYRERKVRILNGGHTTLVPVALLAGLETVRDAVTDDRVGAFLRRAILDEIVPTLDVPDAESFARDVLERFANPFVRHALIDITLHGTAKMRVRVVPSIVRHVEQFGRAPVSLAFGFAAYIAFMRGEIQTERRTAGLTVPSDGEGSRVHAAWDNVDLSSDAAVAGVADAVCSDQSLWHVNLSALNGFAPLVAEHLVRIVRQGARPALDAHLIEPATSSS